MTENYTAVDPCSAPACTVADILDVNDGYDSAAHWNTPIGTTIVAWTCSAACREALEATRDADGTLRVTR